MDISRLRKKQRDERQRGEAPRRAEPRPEEDPADNEGREQEGRIAETSAGGLPADRGPEGGESPPIPSPEERGEQIAELLVFSLSEELYAFRVLDVQEVLRPQRITRVPRTAEFIFGVTSMRGKIIPVMDLKTRLPTVDGEPRELSNIVILRGTDRGLIGILVDRTVDVLRIPQGEIMQPPSHLGDAEARFLEGVVSQNDKFISIIQPKELLDFDAALGDL